MPGLRPAPAPRPWKVWYVTPAFRYERPQAGRYRQHHQLGVEAIGTADLDVDVEIIALGADYLDALGLRRWRLVNTMGTPATASYAPRSSGWLPSGRATSPAEDRAKLDTHPLRVLDSKRTGTQAAAADAPRIETSTRGRPGPLRPGAGSAPRSTSPTSSSPAWSGASTTTRTHLRVPERGARHRRSHITGRRALRRPRSRSWAAAHAGHRLRLGIERMLLACDAEGVPRAGPASTCSWSTPPAASAARDLTHELRRAGIAPTGPTTAAP